MMLYKARINSLCTCPQLKMGASAPQTNTSSSSLPLAVELAFSMTVVSPGALPPLTYSHLSYPIFLLKVHPKLSQQAEDPRPCVLLTRKKRIKQRHFQGGCLRRLQLSIPLSYAANITQGSVGKL